MPEDIERIACRWCGFGCCCLRSFGGAAGDGIGFVERGRVDLFSCPWLVVPAVIVAVISACFFMLALYAEDRILAWASVAFYVVACIMSAECSWKALA
jgi:hypothetical protein